MDLFTSTPPKIPDSSRVRVACEAPGYTVADLVQMVEMMALQKASVNQIRKAVREFGERAATTVAESVWISASAPEWAAWARFWRETKGKNPPIDKRGGWRFPSMAPPIDIRRIEK